ncbi:MAG: MFS transporter [Thermodesulfovibrionales bacterium]|nr:MFS transporter [Thermodesulfovibrionales bacterium]
MNKQILSWCLYDFANSSYSAVIAAVIFPVFYATVIVGNESGLGDLWWGRAISLSMAIVAITSPFLGGIADIAHKRKSMLFVYTALSIVSVSLFYFLQKGMYLEGFILIVLANIGMEGALVFYNSYLINIAESGRQGRVSAWGFGLGYAGSICSLLIALWLIKQGNISAVWPATALFFAVFSIPIFLYLPKDKRHHDGIISSAIKGLKTTLQTFKGIIKDKDSRRFLLAYFIYEDGINTVIVFSSIFAATTLHFKTEEIIILYLTVQVTALIGSFIMARPIDVWGAKKVVMASLSLWLTVSVASYFVYTKEIFFMVATLAGLGLGTVQSASRALFARFIKTGKEAEYFGVYALVGKTSAIIGPLIFGYVSSLYGSQRPAVLSVGLLFLIGMVILYLVKDIKIQRNDTDCHVLFVKE